MLSSMIFQNHLILLVTHIKIKIMLISDLKEKSINQLINIVLGSVFLE